LLNSQNASREDLQNARAVCLLRAGEIPAALEAFRGLALIENTATVKTDAPSHFKTNFATALLLSGIVDGCESVLNDMEAVGELNITAQRIRNAIQKTRRSFTTWERLKAAFGSFARPVDPNFPPGEFTS
jgi:hypothetical protein